MLGLYLKIISMLSNAFSDNRDAWIFLSNDLRWIVYLLTIEMPGFHLKILCVAGLAFSVRSHAPCMPYTNYCSFS
jgi:hypothetical protein